MPKKVLQYFPSCFDQEFIPLKELLSPDARYLILKHTNLKTCEMCSVKSTCQFIWKAGRSSALLFLCSSCYEKYLIPYEYNHIDSIHQELCTNIVTVPECIYRHLEKAYLFDPTRNQYIRFATHSGETNCTAVFSPNVPNVVKNNLIEWTKIPIPDESFAAQSIFINAVIDLGWRCQKELKVLDRGDGRSGRIDFMAQKDDIIIAVEIDNYLPRIKSIRKLQQLQNTFRLVVLRGANINIDISTTGLDAIISAPIMNVQYKQPDITQLLIECHYEIP